MTNREAYVLGWGYGRMESEIGRESYDPSGLKFRLASPRPVESFKKIRDDIKEASDDLLDDLAKIYAEYNVDGMPDELDALPAGAQVSWQIGCYKARSGGPLC